MARLKSDLPRKSGLSFIGDVAWGTHLCQFYQTKKDLVDILVPYFRAGLENNEFCMWITAEPLDVAEAKEAMEEAVPNFSRYLKRGQIEILSYKDWYVKDGGFDCDRVLKGWVSKLEQAVEKGFAGLRLTGNTFWLEKKDWKAFTDYEEAVNNVIGRYRMVAICTYSLDKCNANEIIDVIKNHQFALIKRRGKWEVIESAEQKRMAEDLLETERKFAVLYDSMTEGVALHEVVYDASGNAVDYVITDVNPAFEKITGLPRTQALGKKASELYGTGEPPYLDVYAEVASSGKPAFFETYFPPMKKHFSISVFSPSKGKFNTIFYDITANKKAEEALRASEQRWATTLASIGDAVIATDLSGRVTFMNAVAEELTGWALNEASQKPIRTVFNIINEQTRLQVENPVAKVLEKGVVVGLGNHTVLVRKDGTEVAVDDSGAPIRDEKGTVVGVVLVFRDITERKKGEQALINAKTEWERTFDSVPDLIAILDSQHRIVRANRAMAQRLGTTPERCMGLTCYKCVHGTSIPPEFCPHVQTLQDGKEHIAEVHEDRLGGDFVVSTTPLMGEKGQMIGSVHVARDITERKRQEDEIRRLNERFEMAQHAAGVGVWDWDVKAGPIEWTPEMFRLFGLNPQKDTASFERWASLLHPEDREKAAAKIDEALKTHSFLNNEYRVVRPDGQIIWINALGQGEYDDQNQPIKMTGICIDITERKRTENELRETRDYLENLLNYANAPIIVWDPEFRITQFNHAFERLTGLNSSDAIGKNLDILFPSDKKEESMAHIKRTLEGEYWETVEIPILNMDGTIRTLLWNSANIYDSSGKEIIATIAQGHDITERKIAEAALRESQRDLNRAQAVAKTGSWRLDVQHNELLWSDETYRMFEVPKGTPLNYETFLGFVHPNDRDYVDQKWKTALQSGYYDIEHRIIVNGEVKWVREKAEMEISDDRLLTGGFGTVQDITERKEMEYKLEEYSKHLENLVEEKTRQLRDAERLSAIGETAGMVGHDIRNPLQAIIGELYLAKGELDSLPEGEAKDNLKETVKEIEEQVTYINKIVTDLQDYAKPLAPCFEETDLEKAIQSVLSATPIPGTINVTYSVKDDFPKLVTDPSYIRRIFTNLVSNAIQAMPNDGKLTINAYSKDNKAFITVEDTGEGISEEAKVKIFKPLFTTKAKGQGFGLAVVKKLIAALGGTITFESEPGKGTKFTVELPIKP
jgi:PAS domain S-box-containing protein